MRKTITNKHIAEHISQKHDISKEESCAIVSDVFCYIADKIADEAIVRLINFGNFFIQISPNKTVVGKRYKNLKIPKFSASKNLRKQVKGELDGIIEKS